VTTLLASQGFLARHSADVARAWTDLQTLSLPSNADDRLSPEDCAQIDIAYFSGDVFPALSRPYWAAMDAATNLRWVHVFNAGIDNPVFKRLLDRGVRLTTSSGSTAMPIAQTAIGGMLMLSRPFLYWGQQQRSRNWEPVRGVGVPADLDGQTLTVVGLGPIGAEIARLGKAIGIHTIGVRRSAGHAGDTVDELVHPSNLATVLPRTDWLALACPLTDETRHLVNAEALALLPRGAHLINIARGEVVDEVALIEALRSGHLGGAYLDVFAREPLAAESPLWEMPNVIISPHNSAAATGNDARATAIFLRNLAAYRSGTQLENEAGA
jgi:phosphoglycerate dehydrogenase-like enzyme